MKPTLPADRETSRPGLRPALRTAEATVFAVALACGVGLYLGPSLRPLASTLGPDLGDPRLNLYIVTWVAESFRHALSGLWSPPSSSLPPRRSRSPTI